MTVSLAAATFGQSAPPPPGPPPTAAPGNRKPGSIGDQHAPLDGFWPSRRLTRSLIRRWAQQVGEHYDLRPDQYARIEQHLLNRWPSFLEQNRSALQPLVNEYFEMRLDVNPPTSDQIADWSARAMPVFERVRRHLETGQQQVRAMLTASQQARFDADRAKLALAMSLMESKLRQWSVGQYELSEWWDETPRHRRERLARRQTANPNDDSPATARTTNASGTPADNTYPPRVAAELGAWEAYVAAFCEKYNLDRSQRNAAHSILREMIERADTHTRLNRQRILAIERVIEGNENVEQPDVEAELQAVYGPLDAMFAELSKRLDRLPTDAQLRQAKAAESAGQPRLPDQSAPQDPTSRTSHDVKTHTGPSKTDQRQGGE